MIKRLFIVSNRLPVHFSSVDGDTCIVPAAGGLATALGSYLEAGAKGFGETWWTGVPGCDACTWEEGYRKLPAGTFQYLPVIVPDTLYDRYYNRFSNSVLWPLFHYFPSFVEYAQADFEAYVQVNELFCDALGRHLGPGDTVWIQDYHLLPLAGMLRERFPGLTIGFFLHIPFPSFELFRMLPRPWQHALLNGMLSADLVGFHTVDYAAHFLHSVQEVLGLQADDNHIKYGSRKVKVDVFPISIDFKAFNEAFEKPEVSAVRSQLHRQLNGRKLIFSVDRLDYTKGVKNRIRAFEQFLEKNPAFMDKVVFIMVIVPSRDTIAKYAERKKMIDEMIGRVNSRFGKLDWQPIIYQYHSVAFEEMLGLYTACDLALITPLRDGMNLVAKEFVASRKDKKGVLILSELAGAARELSGALLINPNDIEEMSAGILQGLQMEPEEQERRMIPMQQRIAAFDVHAWAAAFLDTLKIQKGKQQAFRVPYRPGFGRLQIPGCA
jgi:trehalose 6-phosphate synthase/phosphatase